MRAKRTHFITIRLPFEDMLKLNEIAKRYGVNRSDAIRILIRSIDAEAKQEQKS